MRERPTIDVVAAPGGWTKPWPNVAELADHLPSQRWTLIGGLMVQLHAVRHRIGAIRPTNDVDILLHVETSRGVPAAAADALESLGYRLIAPVDPRRKSAHRFIRADSRVELLTSTTDTVDVLLADHAAPSSRSLATASHEADPKVTRATDNFGCSGPTAVSALLNGRYDRGAPPVPEANICQEVRRLVVLAVVAIPAAAVLVGNGSLSPMSLRPPSPPTEDFSSSAQIALWLRGFDSSQLLDTL